MRLADAARDERLLGRCDRRPTVTANRECDLVDARPGQLIGRISGLCLDLGQSSTIQEVDQLLPLGNGLLGGGELGRLFLLPRLQSSDDVLQIRPIGWLSDALRGGPDLGLGPFDGGRRFGR